MDLENAAASRSQEQQHRKLDVTLMDHGSGDCNSQSQPWHRKLDMTRMGHGSGDRNSQSQPSLSVWTGTKCANPPISQLTLKPSLASFLNLQTLLHRKLQLPRTDHGPGNCNNITASENATSSEIRQDTDGSWIWGLRQSIAAKFFILDRMEVCMVTDQPIYTATFTCIFPTSLYNSASGTRHDTDGSWIWGLPQSIATKCTNLDRKKVCKVTDQPIYTATFTCIFPISLYNSASGTRHDTDGSWIWELQQLVTLLRRKLQLTRTDHGPGNCNNITASESTTASETIVAKYGSWIWSIEQTIAAKDINLDRMDAWNVTDQPNHTATFACHFSTSLGRTASETNHDTDGSRISGQQQSIAAKWINLDRKKVCKLTDQPMDTTTYAGLFSTSQNNRASETRHDTDGS
ncbi:MAG: hypothetical protein J3Q66DRAFT_408234 [Benniella sp.]|nr:MAG: hypothetical protein J3Q66DRAFT_408234 [Benniella sp.]